MIPFVHALCCSQGHLVKLMRYSNSGADVSESVSFAVITTADTMVVAWLLTKMFLVGTVCLVTSFLMYDVAISLVCGKFLSVLRTLMQYVASSLIKQALCLFDASHGAHGHITMPVLLAASLSHRSSQLVHLSMLLYMIHASTVATTRVLSFCRVWRVQSVIATYLHLCCSNSQFALLCRPINSAGLVE